MNDFISHKSNTISVITGFRVVLTYNALMFVVCWHNKLVLRPLKKVQLSHMMFGGQLTDRFLELMYTTKFCFLTNWAVKKIHKRLLHDFWRKMCQWFLQINKPHQTIHCWIFCAFLSPQILQFFLLTISHATIEINFITEDDFFARLSHRMA